MRSFFKRKMATLAPKTHFFLACRRTPHGSEREIELRTSSKRPNSEIGALPLDLGIRLGSKKSAIYGHMNMMGCDLRVLVTFCDEFNRHVHMLTHAQLI